MEKSKTEEKVILNRFKTKKNKFKYKRWKSNLSQYQMIDLYKQKNIDRLEQLKIVQLKILTEMQDAKKGLQFDF